MRNFPNITHNHLQSFTLTALRCSNRFEYGSETRLKDVFFSGDVKKQKHSQAAKKYLLLPRESTHLEKTYEEALRFFAEIDKSEFTAQDVRVFCDDLKLAIKKENIISIARMVDLYYDCRLDLYLRRLEIPQNSIAKNPFWGIIHELFTEKKEFLLKQVIPIEHLNWDICASYLYDKFEKQTKIEIIGDEVQSLEDDAIAGYIEVIFYGLNSHKVIPWKKLAKYLDDDFIESVFYLFLHLDRLSSSPMPNLKYPDNLFEQFDELWQVEKSQKIAFEKLKREASFFEFVGEKDLDTFLRAYRRRRKRNRTFTSAQ